MTYTYAMIAVGLLILLVMTPRWYQDYKKAKVASELLRRQLEEDNVIRTRKGTSFGTTFRAFLTGVFVVEFFSELFRLNKPGR